MDHSALFEMIGAFNEASCVNGIMLHCLSLHNSGVPCGEQLQALNARMLDYDREYHPDSDRFCEVRRLAVACLTEGVYPGALEWEPTRRVYI